MDHAIGEVIDDLKRATGHYTWEWDGQSRYATSALSSDLSAALSSDIQALDCKVSLRQSDEGTQLLMDHDEAVNFIERDAHDRAHATPAPRDLELEYLTITHPRFVWQPRDHGFVGYGYTLSQEEELKKPFLKEGIRPEATQVETNHDGPTHGLFITRADAERLAQQHQVMR